MYVGGEFYIHFSDPDQHLLLSVMSITRARPKVKIAVLWLSSWLCCWLVLCHLTKNQFFGSVHLNQSMSIPTASLLPWNISVAKANKTGTINSFSYHTQNISPCLPQVNGKELSKSSHEDAVEAFHVAKDPVVVQVIRRTPSGRPHGPPQEIHVVDECTQTDITFEHIMALAKLRPSTPPVPDVCPFLLSDRYIQ